MLSKESERIHQAVVNSTLDSRDPELPATAFECVLNTEEAPALLQTHPKTLQRMALRGEVPAFRSGDLWRFPCFGRGRVATPGRILDGQLVRLTRKESFDVPAQHYHERDQERVSN